MACLEVVLDLWLGEEVLAGRAIGLAITAMQGPDIQVGLIV